VFGCSTAGEIIGTRVSDHSLVVTAVEFSNTKIQGVQADIDEFDSSTECGNALGRKLPKKGLVHALILSDGIRVNGSELIRGIQPHLPSGVQLTGGLSGDGGRFERTLVFVNGMPQSEQISLLGFYGTALRVGYGSLGGWDPFGPDREVTSSEGNILYELDGQPALTLYKRYLGPYAAGLPETGLLFPLSVNVGVSDRQLVRTILAVNEREQTMTFAGDIPQGASARLMKANFDRLVDGAHAAAAASYEAIGSVTPDLALLISCVGRKLVLKQRSEEELDAVQDVLGQTKLAGFYSYGEICPVAPDVNCELHNQTMTITTFAERV
jgi:hypothetical protein